MALPGRTGAAKLCGVNRKESKKKNRAACVYGSTVASLAVADSRAALSRNQRTREKISQERSSHS